MSKAIGCFHLRKTFKQESCPCLLAISPVVGRSHQQVSAACEQFNDGIPILKTIRLVGFILAIGLSATLVCLVFLSMCQSALEFECVILTVLNLCFASFPHDPHSDLLHGIAAKLLNMEAV